MAFELMVDNTPIAIRDGEIYRLIDGINKDNVPFGFFKNGNTESTLRVFKWLEDRAIPPEREDIREILDIMGISEYSEWAIVRFTGGTLMTDPWWIRFEDNWTYENHTVRGIFHFNPINPYKPLSEHKEYVID
jgi:hypothetical protein